MKRLKDILKKLITILKKYKWCFVAIFIIILLVSFLYRVGFRITYAPELETSWNAVIAFANWGSVLVSFAGVIASVSAVWFAVKVPKQIADRQDKIALFEKIYKVYDAIKHCNSFSNIIELANEKDDINILFLSVFNKNALSNEKNLNGYDKIHLRTEAIIRLNNLIITLEQSKFLFQKSIYVYGYILEVHQNLLILMSSSETTDKQFQKQKEDFKKLMNCEMYYETIYTIERELDLSK